MKIEMGESLFYSWLRHVKACQIVQTNWKVSPQWELKHDEELLEIMGKADQFFHEKYGYRIFKKNSSLSQILQQGECDAIGVSLQDGFMKVYAVDVAFHENGLSYGSRQETVMKIIAKSLRTAMCLYGFFDTKSAEIVFASPKINPAILNDAIPCIADTNELLKNLGYDFKFRIIANEDFNNMVLQPILLLSGGIADTSELFLRSYQMFKMFSNEPVSKSDRKPASSGSSSTDEVKVGALANVVLRRLLESGSASPEEIESYQSIEQSKAVFNLNFPLLVPIDGEFQHDRYYTDDLTIYGKKYRMTSQWYEAQKKPLQAWIDEHRN